MQIKTVQEVSIDAIMEMTRTMEEASSSGKWDIVIELEQKRQPLIRTFFGDLPQLIDGPKTSNEVEQLIHKILATDLQIMQRADQMRSHVGKELQSINKGQRASQAYIQNQA